MKPVLSSFIFLLSLILISATTMASAQGQQQEEQPAQQQKGPPVVVTDKDGNVKSMAFAGTDQGTDPDFKITQENVVPIDANDKLSLMAVEGIQFTSAQVLDVNQKTIDLPIINNQITFISPGVFILTVIAEPYVYSCIVVVGQQPQQIIEEQISNSNTSIDNSIRIIFEKDKEKGNNKPTLDKEKVCLFTPHHPICAPDENGFCPEDFAMNEDGFCFPNKIKCPDGYWRADDDETGACVPIPTSPIYDADSIFCTGPQNAKHIGCPAYYEDTEAITAAPTPTPTPTPEPTLSLEASPTPSPSPEPEPEITDSERTVAEIEQREQENENENENENEQEESDDEEE